MKTIFSIKEKPAAPRTYLTYHSSFIIHKRRVQFIVLPIATSIHKNTKPVMQLLGWNKISPPPLLFFFIHLVLNDLQQKNNKVSKSHFRKFLSTCSQQVNQFFFSVNVSWVTVLLKSLITDSFFLKGPYINKIFGWNLKYHFRFLHGEIGG